VFLQGTEKGNLGEWQTKLSTKAMNLIIPALPNSIFLIALIFQRWYFKLGNDKKK
jgi:hypothetical protein